MSEQQSVKEQQAAKGQHGGGDAQGQPKPKLKICCACPETKKVRDECVLQNGQERCAEAIEAHNKCLRALGFKV